MTFLRRLFGLDFPDPQDGQVWRSRHSGLAFRVQNVKRSDCGTMWHLSLHHEIHSGNFNGIGMEYVMYPAQWRRMLRDEGRQLMGGGLIEPSEPWPRQVNVNPRPSYPRPPAPPNPPPAPRRCTCACTCGVPRPDGQTEGSTG
jgi:hypothetical protein